MFKSFINFLEVGKDKTVHWFVRCQDVFFGIFLLAGGSLMLCYGIIILAMGSLVNGIIFVLAGLLSLVLYAFARKRGKYDTYFPWIVCLGLMAVVMGLLFTGDKLSGLLCVMFVPAACIIFFNSKRGRILTIIMLLLYFGCGLFLGFPLRMLIAVVFVSIFFLMVVSGFLNISEEMGSASDDKISDFQKEAEIQNEIISQLSYQIRTPLNNIVVIGNLLNETPLNQRQKDWMETVIASANTLVNVLNFHVSKVTSTGIIDTKPTNITFNLQTVMNNTVQLFVGQSNEYNIGLKPNLEAAHILEGDPIQIRQIFLTLIDAIIKNKTVEKINIIISYRVRQETDKLFEVNFEIRVSDHLEFDMESNDPKMLNYSLSSKLIDMSGNKLIVTHTQNNTIFSFTLSFSKGREEPKEDVVKIPEKPEPELATPQKDTLLSAVDLKEAIVLLVEDNLINQKIVILSIQKLVKKIEVANNGQEALDKFNTSKHDVILMDIQMPVMDGIQATKKIRETELEKHIIPTPIIAITANALAGDREHCLASGMDEYISKPFQVEVLVSKMKTLLARG